MHLFLFSLALAKSVVAGYMLPKKKIRNKKKNGHQKCLLSVAGFVLENQQMGSDCQMFPVNPESLGYCRE